MKKLVFGALLLNLASQPTYCSHHEDGTEHTVMSHQCTAVSDGAFNFENCGLSATYTLPSVIPNAQQFQIDVILQNAGSSCLPCLANETRPEQKISLSYHLRHKTTGDFTQDGLRTSLEHDLLSNDTLRVALRVGAIENPENYTLQLDFVQDGVKWMTPVTRGASFLAEIDLAGTIEEAVADESIMSESGLFGSVVKEEGTVGGTMMMPDNRDDDDQDGHKTDDSVHAEKDTSSIHVDLLSANHRTTESIDDFASMSLVDTDSMHSASRLVLAKQPTDESVIDVDAGAGDASVADETTVQTQPSFLGGVFSSNKQDTSKTGAEQSKSKKKKRRNR